MFMGVPYVPFFVASGGTFLVALYSGNLLFLVFLPIVIFIMRQMARRDEMIFHLLGLSWLFKLKARNRQQHDDMLVFSPNQYRATPAGTKRRMQGPFLISGKLTRR